MEAHHQYARPPPRVATRTIASNTNALNLRLPALRAAREESALLARVLAWCQRVTVQVYVGLQKLSMNQNTASAPSMAGS